MTEPKGLEALAARYTERADDCGGLARAVLAYLAARPASDLERRMRALAAACQLRETRALLLEAADALALGAARDDMAVDAIKENSAFRARVAKLERELALSREAIKLARNTERKRTEAAEARLAAGLVVAHDLMAGDDVDEIRSRLQQALAAPAQETSK